MGTLASCHEPRTPSSKQDTTAAAPSARYPIDSAGDVSTVSVSREICGGPPLGKGKREDIVSGALQSPEVTRRGKSENRRRTGLSKLAKLAKLGGATRRQSLASDFIGECHETMDDATTLASCRIRDGECLQAAYSTPTSISSRPCTMQKGQSEQCRALGLEMPMQHLLQTSANNSNNPHGESWLNRTTTPTMANVGTLNQHGQNITDLQQTAKAELQIKEERYGDPADTLVLRGADDMRGHLTNGLVRVSLHLGKPKTSGQTSPEVKSSSCDALPTRPFASCESRLATDSFSRSPHRSQVGSPSPLTLPRSLQTTSIPSHPPLTVSCYTFSRPFHGLPRSTHYSSYPTYCAPHSYYYSPPSAAGREPYNSHMNEEPSSQSCPRSPTSRGIPGSGSICSLQNPLNTSPASRSLPRSLLPLNHSRSPFLPPLTISRSPRRTRAEGNLCADSHAAACQPCPKLETHEVPVTCRRHAGHKRKKCGHSQHIPHSPNHSPAAGAISADRARHQRKESGRELSMSLEELLQRYVLTDAEWLEVGAVTGTEGAAEEKGSSFPISPLLSDFSSARTSRCCNGVLQTTDKDRRVVMRQKLAAHMLRPAISSCPPEGFLFPTPGLAADTFNSAISGFPPEDLQSHTPGFVVEMPVPQSQSHQMVLCIGEQGITIDKMCKWLQGHTEMAVHTRASGRDGGSEKWQTEIDHLEPAAYHRREAVGSEGNIEKRDTDLADGKGDSPKEGHQQTERKLQADNELLADHQHKDQHGIGEQVDPKILEKQSSVGQYSEALQTCPRLYQAEVEILPMKKECRPASSERKLWQGRSPEAEREVDDISFSAANAHGLGDGCDHLDDNGGCNNSPLAVSRSA